jgi:hypothetical protein
MSHDMCGNEVTDADGTSLGCMRSAGHWTRGVVPHHDASEGRSWIYEGGVPLIWDGSGRRREAAEIRPGRAAQ